MSQIISKNKKAILFIFFIKNVSLCSSMDRIIAYEAIDMGSIPIGGIFSYFFLELLEKNSN